MGRVADPRMFLIEQRRPRPLRQEGRHHQTRRARCLIGVFGVMFVPSIAIGPASVKNDGRQRKATIRPLTASPLTKSPMTSMATRGGTCLATQAPNGAAITPPPSKAMTRS